MGHLYEDSMAGMGVGNFAQEQCGCVATILCRAGGAVRLTKCLHNTHKTLSLTSTTAQYGCGGAHLYSPSVGVVDSRSKVQGHPRVHRKL